jgi:hypothetical protein
LPDNSFYFPRLRPKLKPIAGQINNSGARKFTLTRISRVLRMAVLRRLDRGSMAPSCLAD